MAILPDSVIAADRLKKELLKKIHHPKRDPLLWGDMVHRMQQVAVGNKPATTPTEAYRRVLENILKPERDLGTMLDLEVFIADMPMGSVVVVVACKPDGGVHSFSEMEEKFPSPELLGKIRLFK